MKTNYPAPGTALQGKKVVLVNHSDTLGGASVVTFRLMQALRRQGVDARMLVYTKTSDEPMVSVAGGTRFTRGVRFCMERLGIITANGLNYSDLFKVSTGSFGMNIDSHPWVKDADIVCLNWINQGLMSLDAIRRLHNKGKKIVWTMHDMWPLTGICHHAYECEYYRDGCGNCQFLAGGGEPGDLSARCFAKKQRLYTEVPITFVAVSNWLATQARKSALTHDQHVVTIPNAFPVEQFTTDPGTRIDSLDSALKPNIILFGAARLDDPIKGLDYTIDALNHIFDNHPDIATGAAAVFFGSLADKSKLDRLRFSHRWLGRVNDFKILQHLYANAKVILSTSLYETLPGTLIEGLSTGALPVTFDHGGQADIVDHLRNGYIARYKDPVSVAQGIMWALDTPTDRNALHAEVEAKFSSKAVADKYIQLFTQLLDQ